MTLSAMHSCLLLCVVSIFTRLQTLLSYRIGLLMADTETRSQTRNLKSHRRTEEISVWRSINRFPSLACVLTKSLIQSLSLNYF